MYWDDAMLKNEILEVGPNALPTEYGKILPRTEEENFEIARAEVLVARGWRDLRTIKIRDARRKTAAH